MTPGRLSDDKSASARPWHAWTREAVFSELSAVVTGLDTAEAARRLERYGPNRLPETPPRGPLMRLLAQFHNLLIYVLLGAGLIAAAMGHWVDTIVILGVVLVNAMIGFVQEGKAEDALRAIRDMLSSQAMVLRDGRHVSMSAGELVPGDIVLLQSGDKVPADLRLFRAKGLQIQEAVLTGESVAVEKGTEEVTEDAALGDRLCMAYSGTLVTHGQASGIVVATGAATEIGRISGLVAQVESLTTPLLRQMAVFSRWLTGAVLVLALAMFAFGVLVRGFSAAEMFMTVVGLAVAAIPEGLPAILTVTLAIGVTRLAGRNAIIRRLPVVETLGSVSVICSDKTGTLTRNEMTVQSIATVECLYTVEGTGYIPRGGFLREDQPIEADQAQLLMHMIRAALLCNDATLEQRADDWRVHGDPMEGALVVLAVKASLEPEEQRRQHPRADLIPFDSEHKFMATLHHSHDGSAIIYLKGAPEQVLARCAKVQGAAGDEQPLDVERWQLQVEELANQGQRVLAVACKPARANQQELDFNDVKEGLVLLGLFGLIDPPRTEAIEAVAECRSAGIRVKMITGDHAGTALAIAAQLDLENSAEAITGHDLDQMDDAALGARAREVDVYARVSPEHKLRLVTLLQAQGAIVAMTGDGVNDAPALKRADVGIAMGHKGTEAAKEASEMVIADDNFASIVHAVEQGRTVYDNLKKAIVFLLPINGGEALSIMIAVLFGFTLPITPVQILWVNMVSSVALAMALAFEATEPNTMRRSPRPASEAMLSGFLLWRIALVSVLMAAGVFGIFGWASMHGSTLQESRTYAVNTLVAMEVFYLFSVRYLRAPSFKLDQLFSSRAALIAVSVVVTLQLFFTYVPFMERFFDTRPVDFVHGVEIIALGMVLFMILELEKLALRRWRERQERRCNPGSSEMKS
ncbi:MAG: cation-transporting P-type ATPase [Sedimenticola sp.]|nr:cation-transporting P-type ATPase [Sedimenticola sp.]